MKKLMDKKVIQAGPMLNVYPDSMGQNLEGVNELLALAMLNQVFQSLYLLPNGFKY